MFSIKVSFKTSLSRLLSMPIFSIITLFLVSMSIKVLPFSPSSRLANNFYRCSSPLRACGFNVAEGKFYLDYKDLARNAFFTLLFILIRLSFRLSNFFMLIRFSISRNNPDLIFKSSGDSVAKLGDRLTSISHGLKSESIRISYPRISKQLFLFYSFLIPY